MTREQVLSAIESFLRAQRAQFELTHTTAGIWSEAWAEASGGLEVVRRLNSIIENGTWNGEVYTPYE